MKPDSRYDDIINATRPTPSRPRMPAADRAAQFSPFAALNGYTEAIERETGEEHLERKSSWGSAPNPT